MDYKEDLLKLKLHFKVSSNRELAEKLDITDSAVNEWVKRKVIPKKYLKLVQNENNTQKISTNNGNNVQIENNHGHININSSDEMSMEICKEIKKLSDVKKEYYYHLIKADVLKEQIEK